MACRPGALRLTGDKEQRKDELIVLWLIAAVGMLAILWLPASAAYLRLTLAEWGGPVPIVVILLGVVMIASVKFPPRQLVAALLMCLALVWLPSAVNRGESQRSFFGVYRVAPVGPFKILMHGTTLHGAQRFFDDDGNPVDDTVPTTYYYPGSPIGQSITKRREVLAAKGEKGRYGIVGLGTGSSSCHKQEGETWRFFEIDPTVINISKNPKNFTFITKCQPDIDIVIGDARLTMAREADESFDLFIIDAFTSDAIPMHMLTTEAVRMYLAKLKSDGVVVLHTSNRYLDLDGVLGAILHELPEGTAGIVVSDTAADRSYAQSISTVVIFAKSEEALAPYRSFGGVRELDDGGLRPWTDDYLRPPGAVPQPHAGPRLSHACAPRGSWRLW